MKNVSIWLSNAVLSATFWSHTWYDGPIL